MQIPIQSGVRVKDGALRTVYPVNLRHKAVESGVSNGELVTTHGAVAKGTGPGDDRGAIVWNDVHYRAMGDKLCSVAADGAVTSLATIADDGLPVRWAFSFDRLGICSAAKLYYWDGSTLTEVTDTDLLPVTDLTWMDGYFVTTDGESIVVTELNDPTSVDPLKYGSAEDDPDPITGVEKLNMELVGFGRETIQFFRNVGGSGFPFQTVEGATIPYGCIGPRAKCRVGDTIAFVGGAKDEPIGVFLISGGTAVRISDEEIEDRLANSGPEDSITMECRKFGHEQHIIVHMEQCSVALAVKGSQVANAALWHVLEGRDGAYGVRHAVLYEGQHWAAQGTTVGVLDDSVTALFGTEPGWSFDAGLLYNDGTGIILAEVEITGRFPTTATTVFFSMTYDGETWSREVGRQLSGRRGERVMWRPGVLVNQLCGLHWRGHGKASIARANLTGEALAA